jgi:hypothetical protein
MKKAAPYISYLLHPLIMPTLGLLIILNSGTYLSLLDPAAKRAIIFIMALGTLIFPLMMLPILFYRKLILRNWQDTTREEQRIPQFIILVLYIITFIYFRKLPLNHVIHTYMLSVTGLLFILMLLNLKFRVSLNTAALGGLTGLIIALIYLYETPLEGFLILVLLAGGISGTSRMALGDGWGEILSGFLLGFAVMLGTILLY